MAIKPRLLLLDEPLSVLDQPTREDMRVFLQQLLVELDIPAIHVTHDRDEALSIGDDLAIIVTGQLRQTGPARQVATERGVTGSNPVAPTRRSSCFTRVHVHVWVRHFGKPGKPAHNTVGTARLTRGRHPDHATNGQVNPKREDLTSPNASWAILKVAADH